MPANAEILIDVWMEVPGTGKGYGMVAYGITVTQAQVWKETSLYKIRFMRHNPGDGDHGA